MIYVVGSGPAGVSCAMALLNKGVPVTLLDSGLALEAERSDRLVELQRREPESWRGDDVAFLKSGMAANTAGIPLKYAFGSDFPYRDPGVDWRLEMDRVDTRPSFAKGGLSNVWGAAILPYRDEDLGDWPVRASELAPHYRAVLNFMPLAGRQDSLEALFPLHTGCHHALQPSAQARDFLADLDRAAEDLRAAGVSFGASRLAMWSSARHAADCRYCALCMYGCPYGIIYSSATTLDALKAHPNFTYRSGLVVNRVEERGERVMLHARDLATRDAMQLQGSRVFLACGVLPTTKILLESLEAYERPVSLLDSGYFLLPMLRFRRTIGVSRERLHTLSQVFLEIIDPGVCDGTVHLQVYTYNELYEVALRKLFGPAFALIGAPAEQLLGRLLIIQGYLPSTHSASIRVSLRASSSASPSTMHLAPVANDRTAPALKRVLEKLRANRRALRALPLAPMLRAGLPGRSFHSGGTFPMRSAPRSLEADAHGRPHGFARVHAVDATIFPSIPSTTITFSVMANAHRIGSAIGEY